MVEKEEIEKLLSIMSQDQIRDLAFNLLEKLFEQRPTKIPLLIEHQKPLVNFPLRLPKPWIEKIKGYCNKNEIFKSPGDFAREAIRVYMDDLGI